MKAVARLSLSAATVVVALFGIERCCVQPFWCGVTERRIEQTTLLIANRLQWSATPRLARASLAEADACIEIEPANVNLYMIAAADLRILGQPARAAEYYERALQFDRRRELLANLGNVQAAIGKRKEAIENLYLANIFWGDTLNDIEDPQIHDEVERRYYAYEASLKKTR